MIGCGLVIVVCIVAVLVAELSDRKEPGKVRVKAPKVEESGYFDLDMTLNWDGYVFTLVNKSGRDWTNVELEINEPLLTRGYIMKVQKIAAGSKVTLRARQFAKPDGTIFNPATTKPQKVSVLCDVEGTSQKGFWLGSFG